MPKYNAPANPNDSLRGFLMKMTTTLLKKHLYFWRRRVAQGGELGGIGNSKVVSQSFTRCGSRCGSTPGLKGGKLCVSRLTPRRPVLFIINFVTSKYNKLHNKLHNKIKSNTNTRVSMMCQKGFEPSQFDFTCIVWAAPQASLDQRSMLLLKKV